MIEIYKQRLMFVFFVACFTLILPLRPKCQLHGKYNISITLNNGETLKPSLVKLLDTDGKLILKKYCDSFGRCRFTGINKGIYRLTNRKYKIDTTLSIPIENTGDELIEFTIIIDFARCNFGARQARREIRQGYVRLLLIGSIAPVHQFRQDEFEKKFNVEYFDFGDSGSPAVACVNRYNEVVFAFLDKKYGNAWRDGVRKDVIGIENYLRMHPLKKIITFWVFKVVGCASCKYL